MWPDELSVVLVGRKRRDETGDQQLTCVLSEKLWPRIMHRAAELCVPPHTFPRNMKHLGAVTLTYTT